MEKKKKKIVIGIGIMIAILSIVGVSYALWTFTGVQNKKNLIQLDCFDITFEEVEDSHVDIQYAYPIIDSEGKQLKPYHFKVTNKCENYANYVVQLEVKKSSTLDDEYLKVMLNEEEPRLLKNENYRETHELIEKDTKIGYVLDIGYLEAKEEKEYDLRIWLDEGVMPESKNQDGTPVQKSKWRGIVTLTATYLGEEHTTLAGKNIPTVTEGDGLYEVSHKDSTLEGGWKNTEYRYAGANPNNYVEFNRELWRIIGLVNVKTTSGEIEQRLKIVRNDSIGAMQWDSEDNGYTNDWTKASLMRYLNEIDGVQGEYYKSLKDAAVDMIDSNIVWNIGSRNSYQDVTVDMFYESERGTEVYNNNSIIWPEEDDKTTKAKVGLIYTSDYGYASSGGSLGRKYCFPKVLYNWGQEEQCAVNDWLKPSSGHKWTLSLYESGEVILVNSVGQATYAGVYHNNPSVYPAIYLKPSVQIVSGTGKENDAYKLRNTSLESIVKGTGTVDTGDGLYLVDHKQDGTGISEEWQTEELRYAGANPNNYVTFNGELWRMIGLVNVKTTNENVEQRIKIVRNDPLDEYYGWDHKPSGTGSSINDNGSNDWTDSYLMEMLNNIYYNSTSGSCWKGNRGGSSTQQTCDFTDQGLKNVQNMIDENIIWNIAGTANHASSVVTNWYEYERGNTVYNGTLPWERPTTWSASNTRTPGQTKDKINSDLFHSIGLIYPSDFGYAVGGNVRESCMGKIIYYWGSDLSCSNNNWLTPSDISWLMTPTTYGEVNVFYIEQTFVTTSAASSSLKVYPTLYLKSNIIVTNLDKADGSSISPYELALLE